MSKKQTLMMFLTVLGAMLFFAPSAFAASDEGMHDGIRAFSAAFAISIAAFGGALAQGRAAAAALEGIARNPSAAGRIMTPMILGLALIESLVIYALLIAFTIAP